MAAVYLISLSNRSLWFLARFDSSRELAVRLRCSTEVTMSLSVAYALGYLREKLPSSVEVSAAGATLFVHGEVDEETLDRLDGQRLQNGRRLNRVEYFAQHSDDKATFELASA